MGVVAGLMWVDKGFMSVVVGLKGVVTGSRSGGIKHEEDKVLATESWRGARPEKLQEGRLS